MRLSTGIAVGVAAVAVAVVVGVSAINWRVIGNSGIDLNGWIALILGVLVTLAVGIGLMTLVFISNRRGYDDPAGEDRGEDR
jgi:hypothetical protein